MKTGKVRHNKTPPLQERYSAIWRTLEQIREWRATGATAQQIAADLNACGHQSRSGKKWLGTTVAKILPRMEVA